MKQGGILEHFLREIEIESQVGQIPDGLPIEITNINKGEMLHVSDLRPPEGVKILTPAGRVVVGVIVPRAEVEVAPAVAAEGAAPTEGGAAAPAAEEKGDKVKGDKEKGDKDRGKGKDSSGKA